jgi:transcriptional regulator with XRE-family HTH domain
MSENLGGAIRSLRRQKGLTLVDVAGRADLSHSFLSQLERGLAQPSMASLHRIAQALGTTQQALMSTGERGPVSLVRAGEGERIPNPGGHTRALVHGSRPMYPIEFVGAPDDFQEYYTHAGDELVHVIAGELEVDLEGEGVYRLGPGDTLYYSGGIRHRWRRLAGGPRLFVVQRGDDSHC